MMVDWNMSYRGQSHLSVDQVNIIDDIRSSGSDVLSRISHLNCIVGSLTVRKAKFISPAADSVTATSGSCVELDMRITALLSILPACKFKQACLF
jgi:hypothetical protein